MNIPLADALAQVELEAGRVYRCEVKGRKVEVRVLEDTPAAPPAASVEADTRLDPWVEFPLPSGSFKLLATPGPLLPPDVPEIPTEENPA